MKTAFKTAVRATLFLTLALALAPSSCLALWVYAPVSKERAKEMGMEVRAAPAGPNQVTVDLEFAIAKDFSGPRSGVELQIGKRDKPEVTAPLREDRSKEGRVVVSFTADRAQLDKLTLSVRVPESDGGIIYSLRVKDFVE